MDFGLIIFESLTLAFIVFGALAIFVIRRRHSAASEAVSPRLLIRCSVLFFVCAVICRGRRRAFAAIRISLALSGRRDFTFFMLGNWHEVYKMRMEG